MRYYKVENIQSISDFDWSNDVNGVGLLGDFRGEALLVIQFEDNNWYWAGEEEICEENRLLEDDIYILCKRGV